MELSKIAAMLLCERKVLPHIGSWHYEIKHDGYRMLAGTRPRALTLSFDLHGGHHSFKVGRPEVLDALSVRSTLR